MRISMAKNADIVALTDNPKYRERLDQLGKKFSATVVYYDSERAYVDTVDTHERPDFIVMSTEKIEKEEVAIMSIQALKFIAPNATLLVVVGKKTTPETATFLKKSGVGMVLFEPTFLDEAKLEYYYSQFATGDLIPIKSTEVVAGKDLPVTIFHILPLNCKVLPIVRKGETVDAGKMKRMNDLGEFYVKRSEIEAFSQWLQQNLDGSVKGIKARCRSQFMQLTIAFRALVNILIDQGGTMSFAQGKELMEKCRDLAGDLITALSDVGDAWDVVNLAAFEDYNPVDRSPAIAAYCGILSLIGGIGEPRDTMVCAMMASLSLLEMSPEGAYVVLTQGPEKIEKPSDKEIYFTHPNKSLAICLEKRLPMSNLMKDIILTVHELPSGKGFPNKKSNRIPYEAQLIRFCQTLDFRNRVSFGRERIDPKEARKAMVQNALATMDGSYSPDLMMKIKGIL